MSENFREAKIVKIIRVTVKEGEGTEQDLSRLVYYYLDLGGSLLFKHDPVYSLQEPK